MIRERKIFVSIFHSPLFNFISKIYNVLILILICDNTENQMLDSVLLFLLTPH